MNVNSTVEANPASSAYATRNASGAHSANFQQDNPNGSDKLNGSLPRLCNILIEDMAQLFNIYPVEIATSMAKQNWPQYRFIYCSENDMSEKPAYKVYDKFSFFLISASLGCATLTNDPSKSVGLIIAEHEED